jgi:DNA-binding CsgD family transcriptional regulator
LAARGLALAAAGRFAPARAALGEAYALAPSLELAVACARVDTELGRYADARRRLQDGRRLPEIALELAAVAFHEGRLTALAQWAEPAREATAGQPVRHAAALALCALAAGWTDDADRAAALLDEAVAVIDDAPDAALAAHPCAAVYVVTAQGLLARFADVERTAERVRSLAIPVGDARFTVRLRLTRALARMQRGALDDALADVDAGEELARLEAPPRLLHFALWLRALVQHERGEPDAAARAAREGAALVPTIFPDQLVRTGTATAALLDVADPVRVLRDAAAAVGEAADITDRAWSGWLLLRLVRAALAAGERDRAERWAALASERAELPVAVARARLAEAELALAAARAPRPTTGARPHRSAAAPLAAARLAAEAATLAEGAGAILDALDARLVEARALVAAGEAEAAKAALQRLSVEAGHRGAVRLRDAAARELRALGTRVASAGQRAAGGELTHREREITALVAAGRSNRQVADTLFLSEKTVANTLTRIYAKLGVRTRAQLSANLVQSRVDP